MNCRQCPASTEIDRGAAREHVCGFTGAEVPVCDLQDIHLVCPLNLSLASQSARVVARTVLLTCWRRGTLAALLEHYPKQERSLLMAAMMSVKNEGRIEGHAKSEWQELRERLAELGFPGMAVAGE